MEERFYTKEQMKTLEDLGVVPHFLTTTVSDYKRGTLKTQDEQVADIYEAASGIKPNRHFGCPKCNYNLYKAAGTLYYKSKRHYEELEEETKTNKRTRKKKEENNGTEQ